MTARRTGAQHELHVVHNHVTDVMHVDGVGHGLLDALHPLRAVQVRQVERQPSKAVCHALGIEGYGQCFGSGFNQVNGSVPDPDSGGPKRPTKMEKIKKFHVLKCWMFSFEC